MTRRLFVMLGALFGVGCTGTIEPPTREHRLCRVCGQYQIPEVISDEVERTWIACGNEACGAVRIERIPEEAQ